MTEHNTSPAQPRKRRRSTETWSAKSTLTLTDATGTTTNNPHAATKASVRWRHGTKQPRHTFTGTNAVRDAVAYQALLAAAYANNWPADTNGRPIPTIQTPAPTEPISLPTAPTPTPLPTAPTPNAPQTVADLIGWFRDRLTTQTSNVTGERLAGRTIDQYITELDFIKTVLTYPEGDPRLNDTITNLQAGDSLLLDADGGITSVDLRRMMDIRRTTNLNTRAANERSHQRWLDACNNEVKAATRDEREPQLPARPELKPEIASGRTAAAFHRTAKALFVTARKHGEIDRDIWDLTDDERPRSRRRQVTTSTIYNPHDALAIADAMSTHERSSRDSAGKPVVVTGDRYRAYVLTAAGMAPRPGELRALRVNDLHLDSARPHVVWARAFKESTKKNSPTGESQTEGSLKARHETVERIQLIPTFLVPIIRDHLANHTIQPTPDNPDPYVFTTHNGAVIHQGNFLKRWWKPTLDLVLDPTANRPIFRSLRKTGITDQLMAGATLKDVSQQVGALQGTIETHYSAILNGPDAEARWPRWDTYEN